MPAIAATSGHRATQRADYQQAHQILAATLPSWPTTLHGALATPLCAAVLRLVALGMQKGWAGKAAGRMDFKSLAAGERAEQQTESEHAENL